ncbi:MAG: hypothetical protein IME92_03355 [Proteobacteria bacterium]|nr:hypothetical protein [Pseudomonadota bacterium]
MKPIIIATITAATFIAPSATFAQNLIIGMPAFNPTFIGSTAQPATKRSISTSNKAVVITPKANTHK